MKKISIVQWFQNMAAPSTPAAGAMLYGLGNQIRVKQASGLDFALGPATTVDAGTFDGGNASSTWVGQPKIDAGAAT